MKTITFIRHGKPAIWSQYSPFSMISGGKIGDIIAAYDLSEIDHKVEHFNEIKKFINNADLFLSSDLKRTKESFQLLGIVNFKVNKLFNEARLPSGLFMKNIKLPVSIWAFLLRAIWLFGYNYNCESINIFKKRMDQAIMYLEEELKKVNHIVIMGHGFVNFFLIRKLIKKRWEKTASINSNRFWSYTQVALKDVLKNKSH